LFQHIFGSFIKDKIMKLFILILILMFCSIPNIAQENCGLSNAPTLLNLRLGISPEQARSAFGRDLKVKVKKKGQRTFFQNFIEKPAPNSLNGVRAIYLRFFDAKLYQIEIFYENRSDWQTLENFTNDFPAGTDLPGWKIEKGRAEIKCAEFSVVADRILNLRIELTDETIRAQVEAIREKENKKK
jgi:hypothetical protein